jgi:nitrous oxidase accessory protein NosD
MKKTLGGLFALTAIACLSFADEGRIPVFEQTTISAPGSYVVTRNITAPGGDVVTIDSDDVTLDLNGMTLTNSSVSGGDAVIEISDGKSNIEIRNGRLSGGSIGIYYYSVANKTRVVVENIECIGAADYGIMINPVEYAEVLNCRIVNTGTGIYLYISPGTFGGKVVGNWVESCRYAGIGLVGLQGGEVRGNRVYNYSHESGNAGIRIVLGEGNIIEGNTVRAGPAATNARGIEVASGGNLISGNTVSDTYWGIWSGNDKNGNRIVGNVCKGNSIGIIVTGDFNILDFNQCEGNGTGLYLDVPADNNVYRFNMLRGNTTSLTDNGTGNTSGVENYL